MDQIRRDSDFEPLPDLHGRLVNLLQEARDLADQVQHHLCAALVDQAISSLSDS